MTSFAVNTNRRSGFTLAEILLAMLVFAIAITTILALLARSIETVDDIVLKDEAMRLSSAVERELQGLPFDQVFDLFVEDPNSNPLEDDPKVVDFLAVHVRTDSDRKTPYPVIGEDDVPGENYWIVPFVVTTLPSEILEARAGRLFRVRMQVSPTNPEGSPLSGSANLYPSAAIVIFAEFFAIGSPAQTAVGRPIYSYNFAVRR